MAWSGESIAISRSLPKRRMEPLGSKEVMEKDERLEVMGSKEVMEKDERLEVMGSKEDPKDNFNVYGCVYICNKGYYRYPPPRHFLVRLYSKLGLHRYNFLQGKSLKLSSLEKYIASSGSGVRSPYNLITAAKSYSITMKAKNREQARSLQTFEAKVKELAYGRFMLTCNIARPQGETKESITDGEIKTDVLNNKYLGHFMPKLPPEDPFKDDSGRFYVLQRSEVKRNDWIRLYLELAVGTTFRKHFEHGVTNLKTGRVAMEIPRDLDPYHKGLGAYDAIFYIEYKDSCKARVGDDVDRVAIVRRILDKHTQVLRLVGRTQSSSRTIQPSNAMEAGSSSSALD